MIKRPRSYYKEVSIIIKRPRSYGKEVNDYKTQVS